MLISFACATAALLAGIAFYRGYDKSFVTTFPFPTGLFGLAWVGGSTMGLIPTAWLGELGHPILRTTAMVLGLVLSSGLAVGLVGIVWMPRQLTPGWYRGWVDRGKHFHEFSGWEHMPRWKRALRVKTLRIERTR